MLKRLYVDNYKCLVNFEIQFQELSLLLGPNGVGKSSVLDVVFALRQLLRGVAKINDADAFPARTLTRWQKRTVQAVELEAEIEGTTFVYRLEVQHAPDAHRATVGLESLRTADGPLFEFTSTEVRLFRDDHSPGVQYGADPSESALARVASTKENRHLARFLDFMRKILVCGLYPHSFVAETATEDPLLHRDGSNFAAWYRHVFQERQDLVPDYIGALREVIDGFTGIRLEKVGQDARTFLAAFEERGERYELRLDELSDGQRALLALYALVHVTAGQGYTLFLDEPDNFVALPEIQPWLITLADACGETVPQAVICSHHPELIDYLGGKRGLLLVREASGAVRTRRLEAPAGEHRLKLSELVARGWER